jgi:alanyl-tRNA synthetase
VRRIEALTGDAARHHLAGEARALRNVADALRAPVEEVTQRIEGLLEDKKRLERELTEAKKKLAMGGGAARAGDDGVKNVGDVKLLARAVTGVETKDLKSLADEGKKQIGSGVVALVGVSEEGRASIVVGVTADMIPRFDAVALVKKGAEVLGGKGGGGRPDMAQAGGPDGSKAEAALDAIAAAIAG